MNRIVSKSLNTNKLHVRVGLCVVLLLLVGSLAAGAGERVKFKNGHSIVAEAVRVEGEIVFLTMSDGSEAGFPKALVEMVEDGHEMKLSTYRGEAKSPRSPGFSELFGTQAREREAGLNTGMRMAGKVTSNMAGKRLTAGFRYKGSVDITEVAKGATKGPSRAIWDRSGRDNTPGAKPGPKTKSDGKKPAAPALAPRIAPKKGTNVK